LPGSISLRKDSHGLYDILHARDFNLNSKDEVIYARRIKPHALSKKLIALCNEFYDQQSDPILSATIALAEDDGAQQETAIYECSSCLTRYDKQYGDPANDVEKGIDFELLDTYACPVCDAPKSGFMLI
jgi:rubredoxin